MKEIPLTCGMVTLVDDDDYEWLNQRRWRAKKSRYTYYAVSSSGGVGIHRIIMSITDSSVIVDHRDGDGLNNQRSNLRIATLTDNNRNARMRKDNTSGYKGVVRHCNRWQAQIRGGGSTLYLGSYDTPEEAAVAYDKAALELHGEFARINGVKV